MIEQISFPEYVSIGPQAEQVRFLTNGQKIVDYIVAITFDDDPRFVRLTCTKAMEDVGFVQLVPVTALICITIGADPVKRGRPPKAPQ